MLESLPIADLCGAQIRQHLDQSLITKYAEAMRRGEAFPPVEVFRDNDGRLFLSDGFHRKHAAIAAGLTEIEAHIRAGSEQDALWFGIGANGKHGKRLTEGDIKHAILLALQTWPDISTPRIAEQVGCSHVYVLKVREQWGKQNQVVTGYNLPARVTGKDGKSYPAKHDKSQRAVAERVEQVRELAEKGATVDQIAEAVGVGEKRVRVICQTNDIEVAADKVMKKTRRIDSNSVIEKTVEAAVMLTEGAKFIDWEEVDRSRVPEWVSALRDARSALTRFINRLQEAAQ